MPRTLVWIALSALSLSGIAQDEPDRSYRKVHARLYKKVSPGVVGVRDGRRRGSGVIVHPAGWILTSSMAVRKGSDRVRVYLRGHRRVEAEIVERIPELELAILKIDESDDPPGYVFLGDSKAVRAGRFAYVLGDSFGSIFTDDQVAISFGVITSRFELKETHGRNTYQGPVLETNAAVNPHQSGAPLVDRKGRLIGLVTLNYDASKFTGLAVPTERFRSKVTDLLHKKIGMPWFGWKLEFEENGHARVESVEKGGPADKAGVIAGDEILAVHGRDLDTKETYAALLGELFPETTVPVRVLRDGVRKNLETEVGAREMY